MTAASGDVVWCAKTRHVSLRRLLRLCIIRHTSTALGSQDLRKFPTTVVFMYLEELALKHFVDAPPFVLPWARRMEQKVVWRTRGSFQFASTRAAF